MNKDRLKVLYNEALNSIYIEEDRLLELGFTKNEIDYLVSINELEKFSDRYKVLNDNELYILGKEYIGLRDYEKSLRCFNRCYEINPNNLSACFQLFYNYIWNDDYDNAFKIYDKLINTDNIYHQNNLTFYLYLLNIITEIPDKYKVRLSNMSYSKLLEPPSGVNKDDYEVTINIRKNIFIGKFRHSLKLLNDKLSNKHHTFPDELTKILLSQVVDREERDYSLILDCLNEERYYDVVDIMKKKRKKCNLCYTDKYILKLAYKINDMIKDNECLYSSNTTYNTFYEAIDDNNFLEALRMYQNVPMTTISKISLVFEKLLVSANIISDKIKNNDKPESVEELYKRCIYKLMTRKTFILLDNLSDDEVSYFKGKVLDESNVLCFDILDNGNKELVLKYQDNESDLNVDDLIYNANNKYYLGDRFNAGRLYEKALAINSDASALIYCKLGLCYIREKKKLKGLECLTIGNYLAKRDGLEYDYADLINKLKFDLAYNSHNYVAGESRKRKLEI